MVKFAYLDCLLNKLPKCPHCGADFPVWDNDHPINLDYGDGALTEFECENCDKVFVCETNISYKFSTAISTEAAENGDWGPQDDAVSADNNLA